MENLGKSLSALKTKFRKKFAGGKFSITDVDKIGYTGYKCTATVEVDGISFLLSLHQDETFCCDHSEFKVMEDGSEPFYTEAIAVLNSAVDEYIKEYREAKLIAEKERIDEELLEFKTENND